INMDYDVIVIGSGPGGEGAAMKAVKAGKKVALCDAFSNIGGNCTHRGTIPSKALRHATQILENRNDFRNVNFKDLLSTAESVIKSQMDLRKGFYDRNWVDILDGFATFVDKNTIIVISETGDVKEYTAEYFVIAAGSRPYRPENVDFSHPRILDSDTVLDLKGHPQSITIYGAGVIGCEYASIFRGLRTKVNLINNRGKLLEFLDDEIVDALAYHLRENGVVIRHNEEYEKVEADNEGVTIYLKSNKKIRTDYLLWAQGRTGNSDKSGLEKIGLEVDYKGSIKVNKNYQTSNTNIYAVGDIVGYPSLASASYDQGRFAATHIVEGHTDYKLVANIPTGIYTLPEISSIGKTEKELTEEKIPYELGRSFFKHLARAQITGQKTGVLKILFHRDTLEILGIHCFGQGAAEIIHIGQAIMSQPNENNNLMYFVNTTFNYPTMAEAYRVAALNGLNRVEE
ncbi:MAG: Si-specific NAD(P)(+) transhydrogenase, partial [Melioribacteraceae bacterium]|nr:Si-specific NAD(P)(+) transhydrogenase [Melioribacteraceae bacterium]